MAKRKRKTTRKQAVRDHGRSGIPGWLWLLLGMILGLGLALFLGFAGYSPGGDKLATPRPNPNATPPATADTEDLDSAKPEKRQYDFYTVLPEMEVVIPDQEIRERVNRREEENAEKGPFLIQVGSFRDYQDADRMKAELAFLGFIANVVEVTINDSRWHRVRIGPYTNLRELNDVKRKLQDNRFDVIVLSEKQ